MLAALCNDVQPYKAQFNPYMMVFPHALMQTFKTVTLATRLAALSAESGICCLVVKGCVFGGSTLALTR